MNALFTLILIFAQIAGTGKLTGTGTVTKSLPQALAINTTSMPNGNQGVSYGTFAYSIIGGTAPYTCTYSVGTLPVGLSTTACVVTGTPSGAAGLSSFTLKVTDALGAIATQPLSILVIASGSCGPPQFPCARTDFNCPNGIGTTNCNIQPVNMGGLVGANTVYTDPYFGTTGIRVTDTNFDSSGLANQSYVATASGSTEEDMANTDDTKWWLQSAGTVGYPIALAIPGTYTGTVNTTGSTVTWISGVAFDQAWTGTITINGSNFTISTVPNDLTITTTAPVGTHTGVGYTITVHSLHTARLFNTGPGTGYKQSSSGLATGSGNWSTDTTNGRNWFYTLVGTAMWRLDFGQTTAPSATPTTDCSAGSPSNPCVFYDYSTSTNCLGASYGTSVTWAANGGMSKFPADQFTASAFSNSGGQGTGYDMAAYLVGSGCQHLRTDTWNVTGDWGTLGTVNYNNTGLPPPFTFKIHNAKIYLNGNAGSVVVRIDQTLSSCTGTCPSSPLIWFVGLGTIYTAEQVSGKGGGHQCMGNNTYYNQFGSPIGNYGARTLTGFQTTVLTMIPSGSPCWLGSSPVDLCYPPGSGGVNKVVPIFDGHCGATDSNATDTIPITDSISDSGEYFGSFPSAWYQEIRMLSVDGSGKVFREGSCLGSGKGLIFTAAQCTLSIGQTGKFTEFTSDDLCAFGGSSGETVPVGCAPNRKPSTALSTTGPTSTESPFSLNTCAYFYHVVTAGTTASGAGPTYSSGPCATGTVTTSGTTVTWVSGTKFNATLPWTGTFGINGVNYTIASVNSTTSITLTTSAGVQASPVSYFLGSARITDGTAVLLNDGKAKDRADVLILELR